MMLLGCWSVKWFLYYFDVLHLYKWKIDATWKLLLRKGSMPSTNRKKASATTEKKSVQSFWNSVPHLQNEWWPVWRYDEGMECAVVACCSFTAVFSSHYKIVWTLWKFSDIISWPFLLKHLHLNIFHNYTILLTIKKYWNTKYCKENHYKNSFHQ